jgi:PPK2 family polyphosphate:nucleotide phosphotransferase
MMMDARELEKIARPLFRIEPGSEVSLKRYDTGWLGGDELEDLSHDELKSKAAAFLERNLKELAEAQELLWASDTRSVLVVLQAMDAAGKDGTIKHVMSGVNPQGCDVHNFKVPTPEELDHTFLWRQMRQTPERGKIVVFNRSHYEDVLVTKVHPDLLDRAKLPPGKRGKKFWNERYDDINNFERHLARNGTVVVKFFLHLSKDEQRRRLLARLNTPDKRWKFSLGDLAERARWGDYQLAYEEALSATSTEWAPWWVIPADHKFVARALVAAVLTRTIQSLDLSYPQVDEAQSMKLDAARRELEAEGQ